MIKRSTSNRDLLACATACLLGAAACTTTSSGSTGPATLATNGGAQAQLSAWAIETTGADAHFLIGPSGTIAYLPWQITLGSVPVGTDCASGVGHGSLRHDASSWQVSIQIAVPYAQGADTVAAAKVSPGSLSVQPLSSGEAPITAPVAEIQIFDGQSDGPDVFAAGTLTISSFSDAGIEGEFTATGTGATTSASSTFSAQRCDI